MPGKDSATKLHDYLGANHSVVFHNLGQLTFEARFILSSLHQDNA